MQEKIINFTDVINNYEDLITKERDSFKINLEEFN